MKKHASAYKKYALEDLEKEPRKELSTRQRKRFKTSRILFEVNKTRAHWNTLGKGKLKLW